MAENKTKPTKESVTKFIESIDNKTRVTDAKVILKLIKKITKTKAVMWGPSIIGYGQQIFKYDTGRESKMPILCFSPRKTHLVFYVISNEEAQNKLLDKLGKYRIGKVCLYINKLADIDIDILEQILEEVWNRKTPIC